MILYVETSIPDGMTIEGYRAARPQPARRRRFSLGRRLNLQHALWLP